MASTTKATPNNIFQYSLHSAYTAGFKDGGPPVAFLSNHGNHGIGYFAEDEDGDVDDMIRIDGVTYAIDKDGDASAAEEDDTCAFVMVTHFNAPTSRSTLPASTTSKLLKETVFEQHAKNTPIPFRLRGTFSYINTTQQTYWDVPGTIFGYYVPPWQAAASGEGLQSCFLSKDQETGGRVIDFQTASGVVCEWTKCARLQLGFPNDKEFDQLRL